jgi:hypothetical protein
MLRKEEKEFIHWNYETYILFLAADCDREPSTVTARSKVWTVFARSNAGIGGSNPTQGMDVCVRLFCVCVAYV